MAEGVGGATRASTRYRAGKLRWWLLPVGAGITLTALVWGFAETVEDAVEEHARAAIETAGLADVWVGAADYRHVTLVGPMSDEDAALAAVAGDALITSAVYDGFGEEPEPEPTTSPSATAQPTATPDPTPTPSPSETDAGPLPTIEPIVFETTSPDLTPAARAELNEVADVLLDTLETHGAITVAVIGYTDSIGTAEANLALSEARARNVADYLVQQGVPRSILEPSGRGEEDPRASNATASGREANRRVEITITEG